MAMTPFSPRVVAHVANLLTRRMSDACGPRAPLVHQRHTAAWASQLQAPTSPTSSENMATGIFMGTSIPMKRTLAEKSLHHAASHKSRPVPVCRGDMCRCRTAFPGRSCRKHAQCVAVAVSAWACQTGPSG
jgi:hypothetical protein